jgi:TolA-binding protein
MIWARPQRSLQLAVLIGVLILAFRSELAFSQEPVDDPAATRKYSIALGVQKQRLFPQAEERWKQFLSDYPKNRRVPNAKHHLGVCQVQQKKYVEAATTFREILSKFPAFPSNDSAQFNLGLALYNNALATEKTPDFQLAAKTFQELPGKYAASKLIPTALFYQAECHVLAGDTEAAVPIYQSIVANHAASDVAPDVYQSLGDVLGTLGRDEEATAALRAFLAKHPKDAGFNDVQLRLGLSLQKQEKFGEAITWFAKTTTIKDFPLADFALIKQAEATYGAKNLPQAASIYESVAAKFPDSTYIGTAFLAAGKCRYQLAQFPNAQNDLTQVIQRKLPEAAEAAYWLGRTLVQAKKPNEALPVLDAAIVAYATDAMFLPLLQFARADVISRLPNRRGESVPLFAQFAAANPEHEKAASALYLAASGAMSEIDYPAAQKYCELFLANPRFAQDPVAAEVQFVAGETYLRTTPPQPEKAEASYRKFVAAAPTHENVARGHLGIAASLYAVQKYDPAAQHLTAQAGLFKKPEVVAESKLLLGRCHLEAKRIPEAVVALRASVAASSNWAHADETLFVLAIGVQASQQMDPALAEFKKVADNSKSTYRDQAMYQMAEIYRGQKKHAESAGAYRRLIGEQPQSPLVPAAMYGVGIVQYESGDLKGAVAELSKLLAAHASSPLAKDAKYLRGMSQLGLQQFQPALDDLGQFLSAAGDSEKRHDARFASARCQTGLKQYDGAIASLTTLLKEKPDYALIDDVLYELAFVYTDGGKPKEAADAFRQLVSRSPTSDRAGECWYRVGEYHQTLDQPAEAIKCYTAGLLVGKLPAVREKTHYRLGFSRYSADQFPEAILVLRAQLKEFPAGELRFAGTYLLGESLYKTADHKSALAELRKVVSANEPAAKEFHAKAMYRGGLCGTHLKDWAAAQALYERLVAEHSDFEQIAEARYGLAVAHQNQNRFDKAVPLFLAVTKDFPESETAAKSWFMMGQCRFAEKKYAEAIDYFSEVAFGFKHDQWQPLSLFEAGRCFIQLQDKPAAISMLETLRKDFPEHARAKDALTILKDLEK